MALKNIGGPISHHDTTRRAWCNLSATEPGCALWCGFEMYQTEGDLTQVIYDIIQYAIVYIISGDAIFIDASGAEHPLTEGSAFQRVPGVEHKLFIPQGVTMDTCYVGIPNPLFHLLSQSGAITNVQQAVIHPGCHANISERVQTLYESMQSLSTYEMSDPLLQAHTLIDDIFKHHRLHVQPSPEALLVEDARKKLQADLDKPLSGEELAVQLNCSYSRIRKLFRSHMGVPLHVYRIRCRIEKAQSLLTDQNMTLKKVAFQLGYPDVHTFNRQFRKITGHPPHTYRKQMMM